MYQSYSKDVFSDLVCRNCSKTEDSCPGKTIYAIANTISRRNMYTGEICRGRTGTIVPVSRQQANPQRKNEVLWGYKKVVCIVG